MVLNDDVEFQFGAGSGGDLKIYHNGSNNDSFIEERGTGNLKIAASQVQFLNAAKDETTAILTEDAGATLYFNNASKFATSASGVSVTGSCNVSGGGVTLEDNHGYYCGAGNDLEIKHDGTNTTLTNITGEFRLDTKVNERGIVLTGDGSVDLYYDNAKKLETTSGGLQVYGDVVFEGATADAHETTLAITDPTADRTITLPNATGTVALTSDITVTLTADQTWTGAQRGAVVGLTDAATILVDFNAGNNFSVTLGANRTLGQPSNQVVGQSGSFFITQDGTGSRTLAYHADYKWVGGAAPTLSTAANAVDRIDYIVAAANKIHCVASLDVK